MPPRMFSNIKKSYKKALKKVPALRALTITTGMEWLIAKDVPKVFPYLRDMLTSLQEILVKHEVREYKFTMELYDKNGKPTKLHFHGYVDKITKECLSELQQKFGYIQNKALTNKEGWIDYMTKQIGQVEAVLKVVPLISDTVFIARYETRAEKLLRLVLEEVPLAELFIALED